MRKIVLFTTVILFMICIGTSVFAEDGAYDEEGWKKRFASPTYGATVAPITLEYNNSDGKIEEDEIVVPGVDFRIFNGMNVNKRGGFYTGYEVGATFYVMGKGDDTYEVENPDFSDGARIEDFMCGMVFLLSKYGYRLDLGTKSGGFSIGASAGIGAVMGGGGLTIKDVDNGSDDTWASESPSTEAFFGPMIEAGIEGAFRFGQNFRLIGVLGAVASPPMEWDNNVIEGAMSPIRPHIRLGFSQNY